MSGTDQKFKSKSRVAIDSSQASQAGGKSISALGQKSIKSISLSRLKVRKQSYGFGGIPGLGGQTRRRSSQLGIEFKRPPLIYLNTYQLEPRVKFHVINVTKAIDSILDSFYSDSKYSSTESPIKTMLIADEVMRTVKGMNFDRFRIIAVVTIAQKRAQSYNNAVAFLWDHEFDSMVGGEFRRPPLVYLNTYQLEPRVWFSVPKVTVAVNSILDAFYSESRYNATESPIKALLIADEVMRTVKEMKFNRYRIISVVTLTQKRAQSYNNAVAFLWDHVFDSVVDVHREDTTSFIQVTVFGVYLD